MSRADSHTPRSRHCVAAATSGSRPECSRVWSRKPSLATTGSWASRSTIFAVDGSQHKAPAGGEGTGPNCTDRGRSGWKWSIATDTDGIPVGWVAAAANRNDCTLFASCSTRSPNVDSSPMSTPCTSTAATTTTSCAVACDERDIEHVIPRCRPRGRARRKRVGATRVALACRTDQLVVDELRSTPTQHRPSPRPPHCRTRTRDRSDHHRQARQMGQPLATPMSALLARALSVGTPPSRLFVDKAVQLASSFVDNPPGRVPVCGSTVRCRTRTLGPCPRGWRRSSDGR